MKVILKQDVKKLGQKEKSRGIRWICQEFPAASGRSKLPTESETITGRQERREERKRQRL